MHKAYSVRRPSGSDPGFLGAVRLPAREVGRDVGVHQEGRVVGGSRPAMEQGAAAAARDERTCVVGSGLPAVSASKEAAQAAHGASVATVRAMARRELLLGLAVICAV